MSKQLQSTDPNDYDVLIRRHGATGYASYCPQLAHIIKGTAHVEVENAMKEYVLAHIEKVEASKPQQ